jgi:alanine racemase
VEVDLAAVAENVREVLDQLAGVKLMAVVKADAYGHGAVQVARAALGSGASWVATATLAEAAELRESGITSPCLVLGYTPPDQVELAVRMGLTVTAFDREVLEALAAAGGRFGRRAIAHLKVDTGMSRLGVPPEGVRQLVDFAAGAVDLEGIYTHLRKGEDAAAAGVQLQRFHRALDEVGDAPFRLRHVASSSGWVTRPDARFEMVRLGGELLGLRTADGRRRRPALAFKTTVAQVRWVDEGEYVGYGDRFRAPRRSRIATIPVGYGDGFRRGPTTWGSVLIRGQEHPLAGDVCMDMAMVDVTGDPQVARGDEVVLIGRQQGAELTVEQVADRLQVLNYELVTQILPRVPREPRWGD